MAQYSFKIAPYKTQRLDKPIILYVIFSRDKRRTYSTNIYVENNQWDDKNEIIINHPGAAFLNKTLQKKKQAIQELEITALKMGQPFTTDYLDGLLRPEPKPKPHETTDPVFTDYMRDALYRQTSLKDSSIEDQYKTYKRFSRYFPALRFRDFTYNTLTEFEQHCLDEKQARSTIAKHHKNLKKYLNLASKEGVYSYTPDKHPYANFKVQRIKGNRAFLTAEELHTLETGELPDHLESYRQCFLFICYTGLRISDFMRLDKSMLHGDMLNLVPLKTEDSSGVEVHLPIKELFGGKPYQIWERANFEFPNKTAGFNNRMNIALKQIALLLGIPKHLSCHVGRHTFLTHIAMKTGNVFAVMNLGGLRKVDTAMVYIHLAEQDNKTFLSNVRW